MCLNTQLQLESQSLYNVVSLSLLLDVEVDVAVSPDRGPPGYWALVNVPRPAAGDEEDDGDCPLHAGRHVRALV